MIEDRRFLVTGGAGTIGSTVVDQLAAAGAREIVVLGQLRPRHAGTWRRAPDREGQLVDGDIRDRPLVAVAHVTASTSCSIRPPFRITQCTTEPRLALEVLVNGTYEVVEAAADADVRKVIASSSASVYGLAEDFPTRRRPSSLRQRHPVRCGQGL